MDIGITMGAFALSSVLCRPWISEMIDKIGRKRSYTIGCIIMTILPVSYLLFRGELTDFYYYLILVRMVHGVGLALCFTSTFTYIADIIPRGRLNEGLGMFGVTGLTGLAIGPLVAEIIIRDFGFSMFFITSCALAGLGLVVHLPLPETYVNETTERGPSFFSVLQDRKIFTVALLAFLFGFGLAASGSFVSPFAEQQHLAFISLYYVSYSSAAVVTRLFGGRLADRIGEERVIPFALVLTGAGLMLMILLGGGWVLILSGLMSGCGHGFLFPCLNSLAVRNEPVGIRGKITGVFTGALDAGAFSGSVILGYIGELAGFRALFFAAGLALFTGHAVFRRRIEGQA